MNRENGGHELSNTRVLLRQKLVQATVTLGVQEREGGGRESINESYCIAGKFGGLVVYITTAKLKSAKISYILTYIHMVIPY